MIANRYQPLVAARPDAPQRARDQATAQTVLLREAAHLPPDRMESAISSTGSAKGIFHQSLVTLFDATQVAADRLLLAYEFVPAQTLRQVCGGHPFNPRRAAELMSEIADAVAELHSRGITHGAITADTVLITLKGKAKLDRLADPTLRAEGVVDEETDLKAIIALLREVTKGGKGMLPVLDAILEHDDGASFGSAATLAASLRAAASSEKGG